MMSLKDKLNQNTAALMGKIGEIADDQFNAKPDDISWSPAQVIEHLYRAEFGVPKLFSGETKTDPDRDSEKIIEKMRVQFLESDRKLKARGVILPGNEKKSKEVLSSDFRNLREEITLMVDEYDGDQVCILFEHPVYGYLTREEWIHFNIFHTKRHMRQIDHILARL
jgi:hypothetical protein